MPVHHYNEDINTDPQVQSCAGESVTLGDLHGNAKKLMHFLVKHRVFKADSNRYQQLCRLYDRVGLDATRFKQGFSALIDNWPIEDAPQRPGLVRLIGDVFADRGVNDYLTLRVLKRLTDKGIQYTLHMANHDIAALAHFTQDKKPLHDSLAAFKNCKLEVLDGKSREVNQSRSLFALEKWIQDGVVTRSEVADLFNINVVPALKLIDYNINDQGKIS